MTARPRWAREAARRRVPPGAGSSVRLVATCPADGGVTRTEVELRRGPDGRVWVDWWHNGHRDQLQPLPPGLVDYLRAVVR